MSVLTRVFDCRRHTCMIIINSKIILLTIMIMIMIFIKSWMSVLTSLLACHRHACSMPSTRTDTWLPSRYNLSLSLSLSSVLSVSFSLFFSLSLSWTSLSLSLSLSLSPHTLSSHIFLTRQCYVLHIHAYHQWSLTHQGVEQQLDCLSDLEALRQVSAS